MSPETAPRVAPSSNRGGAAAFVLPLYTLTLFLSAFLLFAVQPMFTKMVLPLLGGSAAVWNTAVVFFQGTLLLGYFYAHLTTRHLGPRAQTVLHGVVLLLGLVFLPIGVAHWAPPAEGMQIPWLIGLLAVSIGGPFFAVSATAPLLQKWFAHTDHAAASDPYFLYGGSNLGSLAALLAYPIVVEPLLGLRSQGMAWTVGYVALGLFIGACGMTLVRRYQPVAAAVSHEGAQTGLARELTWKLRLRWLALSTVPSALLLGTTLHMGNEIAAAPFLWVIPLALYLLTFVLVFSFPKLVPRLVLLPLQAVFVALLAAFFDVPDLKVLLFLHIGAMFFTTLMCHGELARLRPAASHLTEFYLWMSIGGVLGGILAAIVAPLVFSGVYEYPIALLAGVLLRPHNVLRRSQAARPAFLRAMNWLLDLALPAALFLGLRWWVKDIDGLHPDEQPSAFLRLQWTAAAAVVLFSTRPLRLVLAFMATLLIASPGALGSPTGRILRERSFFGVYSVYELETPFGLFHFLMNGGVLHGGQNMDRPLGPTTYYTREGPVGQFFEVAKGLSKPVEHIGVVGLGVGALAPFLSYGQRMTYFEIDPLDERIARDRRYFTYLPDAGDKIEVKVGDGRLLLEKEPDGSFDVIVVAAFSGDAIPVHLITMEALDLYFRKLGERGLLLMNVTNAYLDLMPLLGSMVAESGLHARISRDWMPTITAGGTSADYVVVARTPQELARFGNFSRKWSVLEPDPEVSPWTDDFSNMVKILRWKEYSSLTE